MMKCLLFPLSLLFLLQACSDKSHNSNPEEVVAGWRSAGITWPDAVNTGGAFELAAVGDHLFVLDSYTPRADSGSDTRPRRWRIWKGTVGSENWELLAMPDTSVIPLGMQVLGSYLFVATFSSKGLWRFDPFNEQWTSVLQAGKEPIPVEMGIYIISSIGTYKDQLVASVWGEDTLICWMGGLDGNHGKVIPCPGKKQSIGSLEMQELNGALYGISPYYGIFRYTEGAASWDSLSSPRGRNSYEIESVTSVTAHDGHLIVGYEHNYGYNSGIYRLEKDDSWTLLTPKYMYQDSVAFSDAMESTDALLSYRGWLIAGGMGGSVPSFWVPLDSSRSQFGDWRIVYDNWNDIVGGYYDYPRTYDLLGVGDTLYAAARTAVLKLPLNEIQNIWGYKYNAGML